MQTKTSEPNSPKPLKKARLGFLLKITCYCAAVAIVMLTFSGRTDRLIKSNKNQKNLPELLTKDFPQRNSLILEFKQFRFKSEETELRSLERFILEKIPWESDWRNWSVREYIPSPQEVIKRKKEDCDGRAILFTNLARTMGHHNIEIVWTDSHVWTIDRDGNHYLLYAPSDLSERGEEKAVEISPEFKNELLEEKIQIGDNPPPTVNKTPFLQQVKKDVLSMHPSRIITHLTAGIALLLVGFFIPSGTLQKK